MNKDKLLQEKEALLRWMDSNDAHMNLYVLNQLRKITEQLSKIQ